ncbi:c-type cytochrome [Aliiruegeria sabulilitoris]|uniref:c-type cytochrome n=1 Tax=Aliiruegeria sabulilitoris TaxID=1510458 RepID=UPI000831D389|nr:cytochrome c [Aliiruegeria sabulilitoris]
MRRLTLTLLLLSAAGALTAQEAPSGKWLYTENCVDCHGEDAEGDDDAAPDIRGANRSALDRALPGFDQMPEFDFTEDEIRALQAYLKDLENA